MKDLKGIVLRFIKVIYILTLLIGLIVGWSIWTINTPYQYTTYNYFVECDNGKTFDPTSKPIDKNNFIEPYSFNDVQLKSECEYGTAWVVPWAQLSKNYKSEYKEYTHTTGTIQNQIKNTLIGLTIYYLVLEVIRRTLLYIFVGKKFFHKSL